MRWPGERWHRCTGTGAPHIAGTHGTVVRGATSHGEGYLVVGAGAVHVLVLVGGALPVPDEEDLQRPPAGAARLLFCRCPSPPPPPPGSPGGPRQPGWPSPGPAAGPFRLHPAGEPPLAKQSNFRGLGHHCLGLTWGGGQNVEGGWASCLTSCEPCLIGKQWLPDAG